jgi:cytosine/adenosine deaminase-related metal-dependent hydrolase
MRLLSAGVNVSIGTDSLASNWSLSMLDELKFLANNYEELSSETLISLLTINGTKSLKLKNIGKLEKDWQADLIAVRISDDGRPVFDQVCDETSENLMTIVAGTICYKNENLEI